MAGYDTITFGGTTLTITNMRVRQVPATIKQKVGRVLVQIPIIGRDALDYEFTISGYVTAASLAALEAARDAIEALNDVENHALVTGIASHVGNYIMIPDSLSWLDDSDDVQGLYKYSFILIQYQQ